MSLKIYCCQYVLTFKAHLKPIALRFSGLKRKWRNSTQYRPFLDLKSPCDHKCISRSLPLTIFCCPYVFDLQRKFEAYSSIDSRGGSGTVYSPSKRKKTTKKTAKFRLNSRNVELVFLILKRFIANEPTIIFNEFKKKSKKNI